jgi:hypothetical protein
LYFDILTRRSELYNEIIEDINAKNPKALSEAGENESDEVEWEDEEEETNASNDSNEEDKDEAARLKHKEDWNFCSTRCHGGRGKNAYCTLCYSEEWLKSK